MQRDTIFNRWQLKTLLSIDERVSKTVINDIFDCKLLSILCCRNLQSKTVPSGGISVRPAFAFTIAKYTLNLFSSPEPKAHGELIVYQSSRRLCVCV